MDQRMSVSRCCCGDVLIWQTDWLPHFSTYFALTGFFLDLNLTVHDHKTWTGNIFNYRLVIWPLPIQDAPWWADLIGGDWAGRVHLLGEWSPAWDQANDYINTKTPITGLAIVKDNTNNFGNGTVEPDPLTVGMPAVFKNAATSRVSGGKTLSFISATDSRPWLQRRTIGPIDWVLSGDTNHISDYVFGIATANAAFCRNLWTAPV